MGLGGSPFGSVPFGSGEPDDEALAPPDESDGIEQNTDYCESGKDLLLEQYKGKPRMEAMVCILREELQEVEDALWDLYTRRSVNSATWAAEDVLGAIVGRDRAGMSNEDYRCWIKAQILVNRSSGYGEELIAILKAIFGQGASVELREYYPASVIITLNDELAVSRRVVGAILQTAKAAGVRLIFEHTLVDPDDGFTFAPDTDELLESARGFGWTADAAVGGGLAGAIA